ncbi:fungal-specific transcription factor domain-containing protein [Xylaria venustula]|nr:fungal-specific transcription factor domain-containing protein [Xylaria venustula]
MSLSTNSATPIRHEGPKTAKSSQPVVFVSNQTPETRRSGVGKRKRTSAHGAEPSPVVSKIRNACVTCREKKTRCSGHQPCVRCEQNGQPCQYMPTVSGQAHENSRNSHASPTLSIASGATSHSQASLFPGEPDHVRHRKIRSHGHSGSGGGGGMERLDTPDDSLQEDQNGHFHGGASEFAFMQLAKKRLASLPAVSIDFSDHPLPQSNSLAPVLPPKSTADQLITGYFDFGLSTSRVVHQPSLINIFDKLYDGEEGKPDDLALAYIVLALGSHYSSQTNPFCGYSASVRFYNIAQAQLDAAPDLVTLATSQARFLIIHYLLNHARMHEAWAIFGILVRHIQALGLHRHSQLSGANCIRYEYRKRLFWSVYIHDRILSSMFGRPLAMCDDDIDQEECVFANDEDIEESRCQVTEDGVFCSAAALVHYARLARILGQILRGFYTPSARLQDITRLHSTASVFEKALKDWQSNLPPYLNYVMLPRSAVSITAQRQMCTLKLMFAHASLLLYRPFILHAIYRTAVQTSSRQWIRRCHEKAIDAANTVVSECSYLTQRGLFSRKFWLVTYMQFASIGTLLTYSYLWPEDVSVRKTAEEAMGSFPIGIEGDPVGQRYLATLKELREMTVRAQNNSSYMNISSFDVPAEQGVERVGDENTDRGPWTNFFFDSSIIDDMMIGYNGYRET